MSRFIITFITIHMQKFARLLKLTNFMDKLVILNLYGKTELILQRSLMRQLGEKLFHVLFDDKISNFSRSPDSLQSSGVLFVIWCTYCYTFCLFFLIWDTFLHILSIIILFMELCWSRFGKHCCTNMEKTLWSIILHYTCS